jgi:hypothetical protein
MSCCHHSYPYTTGYSEDRISCRLPVVINPIHILQGTVRKEYRTDDNRTSIWNSFLTVPCSTWIGLMTTGHLHEILSSLYPVVYGQDWWQQDIYMIFFPHCTTTGYSEDRISCRCPVVISPIHILQGTVRKEFHIDVLLSSVLSIYYRVQWGKNFM